RELLADVGSQPVQKLREKMGEFTELRELLERAVMRELLADVGSQPVQKLREKMGEFTELRELLERA
ncbi:hypothetical protein C9421_30360, partial [Klebsiella pneumoniae]